MGGACHMTGITVGNLYMYLCLNHLHALVSEVGDDSRHINIVLTIGMLEEDIQGNKGSTPPHASTVEGGTMVRARARITKVPLLPTPALLWEGGQWSGLGLGLG